MHTGNILGNMTGALLTSVYPCAYREHKSRCVEISLLSGLSLCIQGTFACGHSFQNFSRFIPVHTGNMLSPANETTSPTVYPCAYREHDTTNNTINIRDGLSLCIQGTCSDNIQEIWCSRFIPVHTGNM